MKHSLPHSPFAVWLCTALALVCTSTFGVLPGMLDTSFKTGSGFDQDTEVVVRLKDGKLLVGGSFDVAGGLPRSGIARLLANGKPDPTFNPGSGTNGKINRIIVQPNGKILIAGSFTDYNGTQIGHVARLNADGSIDPTFATQGGPNSTIFAMALQSDGKVIIGGDFFLVFGNSRPGVARLNPNGSLDTSFLPGSGTDARVLDCAVQSTGEVLICGLFTTYNGTGRAGVARILSNGTLDSTFNPGSGADDFVFCMATLPGNKVLIGGDFNTYNGTGRNGLARLNDNGTLDTSFDPGAGANNIVVGLAVQGDGKIMIVGDFTDYDGEVRNRVARVNTDGSPDLGFDPGPGADTTVIGVTPLPDGKVIITGQFIFYDGVPMTRLARINRNGSVDTTFNTGGSPVLSIADIARQPDGKILVAGQRLTPTGLFQDCVLRLQPNGDIDTTFDSGTGADDTITKILILPDGDIIVAGAFTTYNGASHSRLVRLNDNGTIEPGFTIGTGPNDTVQALSFQPATFQIAIGGVFSSYNGSQRGRVAVINLNGTLENTFAPAIGTSGGLNEVSAVVLQPDGRVVMGGNFTSFNGIPRNNIARANSNGTLDTGFDPGTGASASVKCMEIQPDGRLLVGGIFNTFNSISVGRIARLNTNGSLDLAFSTASDANASVFCLKLLPDGGVLIGGTFASVSGTISASMRRLARLNFDGTLDRSFSPGRGPDDSPFAIVLQPDGKALIAGGFRHYDGQNTFSLVRIHLGSSHVTKTYTGVSQHLDAPSISLRGRFTLALSKSGNWTAKLALGTETPTFKGFFDFSGSSQATGKRKDGSALMLDVVLTRNSNGTESIQGTMVDFAGRRVLIVASPPFFSTKTLPANHFAGTYNAFFQNSGNTQFTGALPVSGPGFMTIKVGLSGATTITGKFSEGTAFTTSLNLADEGLLRLHIHLQGGKGFLSGTSTIDDSTMVPNQRPITSSLTWRRAAAPGPYPVGFDTTLGTVGSQYVPKESNLPPFGNGSLSSIIVSTGGGHLAIGQQVGNLTFALNGTGQNLSSSISDWVIKINRANGSFTGSFLPPPAVSTKRVTFQGVIGSRLQAGGFARIKNTAGVTLPSAVDLSSFFP